MIKNNFNTLMAERQLKITRVSNDTGISRTTLTALSQEMSKGVQLALLFINVFDNKGLKKHTFEILYFVLTTYNTTVDVDVNNFGEILGEIKGNSSKVILDQKQFENGDNEFIIFLKQLEVQWQTKIIDDIMQYMTKDIDKKVDGDFVSYLEVNFNRYI